MGGYSGGGALGGLLNGMVAGRQLRMQLQRAADEHQQVQQALQERQQQGAMKMITDRMNLEMSGARPVDNGMVEQDAAMPSLSDFDANLPKTPQSQPEPTSALGMMRDMTSADVAPGAQPTITQPQQGVNPLDELRAAAASEPGTVQRFTRKANKGQVVSVPWFGGQKIDYELPTPQEQLQRQAQIQQASQMREKLGAAAADTAAKQFVLRARGQKLDDDTAKTLGIDNTNPWSLFLPEEIPGMREKAAQIRKAGFMEVPAGGAVVDTNTLGRPAQGATPAGSAPTGPTTSSGASGVAVFRNPPLEDPGTRAARAYTAELLGKRPEDVSMQELAKGKADWELLTMNPLDRKVKEGELQLQPLTAAAKRGEIANQALDRSLKSNELELASNDDLMRMAGEKLLQTGQLGGMGRSKLLMGKAYAMAAQIASERGLQPDQVPGIQNAYKAMSASLDDLTKRQGQIEAFEKGGAANLDNFIRLAQKQVDAGSPLINRTLRGASKTITGSPDQAAADAARVAAFNEISKILSGSLGNGAVSDSARKETEDLLRGDYTMPQLLNVAKVLRQDMKNRSQAYGDQINSIRQQMQNLTKPSGGTVKLRAPNGDLQDVPADQVDHYIQLGAKRVGQ